MRPLTTSLQYHLLSIILKRFLIFRYIQNHFGYCIDVVINPISRKLFYTGS